MSIWKVQLFETNFDDCECAAAEDVVRSGWLTMGRRVAGSSGSSGECSRGGRVRRDRELHRGAHMAMLALDVAQDDES
jgi:hypothetical protein